MLDETLHDVARLLGINPSTLPSPIVREQVVDCDIGEELLIQSIDLTEEEYALLVPFLPAEPKHCAAITNQQVLRALLWAQAKARPLTHAPRAYGTSEAVRKRAERWALLGVGEALLQVIDSLSLRPNIESAIKRLASDLARRGDRIRKAREKLR